MRNDSFLYKFLYKTAIDIVEMQKYQCNVKLGFQWKMLTPEVETSAGTTFPFTVYITDRWSFTSVAYTKISKTLYLFIYI